MLCAQALRSLLLFSTFGLWVAADQLLAEYGARGICQRHAVAEDLVKLLTAQKCFVPVHFRLAEPMPLWYIVESMSDNLQAAISVIVA